jgi:hypothetical protein
VNSYQKERAVYLGAALVCAASIALVASWWAAPLALVGVCALLGWLLS